MKARKRKPVFYWHFVSWYCFSLGITLDFESPNIEIHIPFGFIRAGMQIYEYERELTSIEIFVKCLERRIMALEKK